MTIRNLKHNINRAVLALLESGDIGRIRSKWFGNVDR